MAPFCWPKVEHDIALYKEIIDRHPMKGDDWEDIVVSLSSLFTMGNKQMQLKEEGCCKQSDQFCWLKNLSPKSRRL